VLARIRPYRAVASPGGSVTFTVEVRNPLSEPAPVHLVPVLPDGWTAGPVLPLVLGPGASTEVLVTATVGGPPGANRRIAVDLTVGSLRLGQHAEALVDVVVGVRAAPDRSPSEPPRGPAVAARLGLAYAPGAAAPRRSRPGPQAHPHLEPTESPHV
jgi:hypothetical protein